MVKRISKLDRIFQIERPKLKKAKRRFDLEALKIKRMPTGIKKVRATRRLKMRVLKLEKSTLARINKKLKKLRL